MRFQLYQAQCLTAIGLSNWQKVHKLGVCEQFRDSKVTLKLNL